MFGFKSLSCYFQYQNSHQPSTISADSTTHDSNTQHLRKHNNQQLYRCRTQALTKNKIPSAKLKAKRFANKSKSKANSSRQVPKSKHCENIVKKNRPHIHHSSTIIGPKTSHEGRIQNSKPRKSYNKKSRSFIQLSDNITNISKASTKKGCVN